MIVKGIMNLDYHTPEGLRKLWAGYKMEYSVPDEFTTTVYQFGISEETSNVASFAYRSTNDFRPSLSDTELASNQSALFLRIT